MNSFLIDIKKKKFNFVSDNGCQPTSQSDKTACREIDIRQIFTSFNNPKGKAETERGIRTLKEEIIWPNDLENGFDDSKEIGRVIKNYNEDYHYSSIYNLTLRLVIAAWFIFFMLQFFSFCLV